MTMHILRNIFHFKLWLALLSYASVAIGLTVIISLPNETFAKDIRILETDIMALQESLEKGKLTSEQLVKHYLARIDAYDQQGPQLNTIIRINPRALEQAIELDLARKNGGVKSLLHGIPVILKDNFNTYDIPTTAGSVALAGFVPKEDAFQVKRLRDAGAVILAKANMDEFAGGITGLSSLGGQSKNPYDITRIPGGSSGGTAAAIAANFAVVGMGTDTCGSIRIPASYNNLVGLRPSKGLSSISGIVPLSHSLDVGGPLTRTVKDLAIVMDIIVGYDPMDSDTLIVKRRPFPGFVNQLGTVNLSKLRLGKLEGYFDNEGNDIGGKVVESALNRLRKVRSNRY